jgi:hypothetical protein
MKPEERAAKIEELLHDALNLAVRARKLDEMALAQEFVKLGSTDPAYVSCGTPHLWVLDQYDKDLAAWEEQARNVLKGSI